MPLEGAGVQDKGQASFCLAVVGIVVCILAQELRHLRVFKKGYWHWAMKSLIPSMSCLKIKEQSANIWTVLFGLCSPSHLDLKFSNGYEVLTFNFILRVFTL